MDELTVLTWRIPRADADVLERATLPEARRVEALATLREAAGAQELVYVPTCQRVAFALLRPDPEAPRRMREAYRALGRDLPEPETFVGRAAFHHLAEAASSLDSLVVGEPQVLGQFKDALSRSEEAQLASGGMRHVFGLVFRAAKAVRTQTDLFRGKVSLVPLTESVLEAHLAGKPAPRAAVLGTGTIGQRAAQMLREKAPDARLHLVSRSAARAADVAAQDPSSTPHALDAFLAAPPADLDVLVLAMAADAPFVGPELLARVASPRGLLVLDLAMPRNAAAPEKSVEGLRLVQLDELARLSEERKAERLREADEARRVLDQELARIEAEYEARKLHQDLAALADRFDETREARWAEAPKGLDRDDPQVRKWYEQTVRALLHEAAAAVKKAGCRPPP